MFKSTCFLLSCLIPIAGQAVVSGWEKGPYRPFESQSYSKHFFNSDGMLRDQEVRKLLKKLLHASDLRDRGRGLRIDVRRGRVTISGELSSEKEQEKLYTLLNTLENLRFTTRISIRGERGYKISASRPGNALIAEDKSERGQAPSDGELREKIKEKLRERWLGSDYPHVTFEVEEGVVTLKGIVDDQGSLEEIESRLKELEGVRVIKNNLTLLSSEKRAYPKGLTDEHIRKKVEQELEDDWWSDYSDVEIEVDEGTIILRGSVEDEDEIEEIEERLIEIPGVKVIRSRLQLKEKSGW